MAEIDGLRGRVYPPAEAGPPALAQRACELGVAAIAAAMGAVDPPSGLVPADAVRRRSGVGTKAGYATTAWSPAGNNTMTWFAIGASRDGDVLVLTTPSDVAAQWGELAATAAVARGVEAVVVAGAARDVEMCRRMEVSVWARAVNPAEASKSETGYVNAPVDFAGAVVRPGDLVVADDDGVVVVPRDRWTAVIELATSRAAAENETRTEVADGVVGAHLERKLHHVTIERMSEPWS